MKAHDQCCIAYLRTEGVRVQTGWESQGFSPVQKLMNKVVNTCMVIPFGKIREIMITCNAPIPAFPRVHIDGAAANALAKAFLQGIEIHNGH